MWRSESWPGFGTSAMLPGLRSEALWLSFWLEGHGHCWLSLGMTEVTFSSPQPTPPVPGHCPSPGSGPQLWCSFLPPPWVHPPRWATSSSQSSGLTRHSPMVNPSMGALNLRLTLSSRLAQIAHHCLSRTWLSLSFLMLAFKKKLIKLFPLFHIFLSLPLECSCAISMLLVVPFKVYYTYFTKNLMAELDLPPHPISPSLNSDSAVQNI